MLALTLTETPGGVRLRLGALAQGDGATLQEAADALVRALAEVALAVRAHGPQVARELQPDLESITLLHELGELAAAGRDLRPALFD
jgi:hypothetical protein